MKILITYDQTKSILTPWLLLKHLISSPFLLKNQEVDAAVFSLSLMGSNHVDYLKEGFRILKPYGSLFICEPKKKAESRMENLKKEIEDCGFKIIDIKPSSHFIYFNAVKIWSITE